MQSLSRQALPKVLVLGTGGTIAGISKGHPAQHAYDAAVLGIEELLGAAPGIERLASVQSEQIANLDSKDMQVSVWRQLAERIAAWHARPDAAGCVIAHGSDTLEETAFFLHCVLPAGKPVVLTAAMRPATALSPDGPRNLYDAVQVAASPSAAARGVLCVVHGRIHAARDIAKTHPVQMDAFGSGDYGPLGFVGEQGVLFTREIPAHEAAHFPVPAAQAWPRVEIVNSHAGADGAIVRALLGASRRGELVPPLAGLVVAGTGSGTVHEQLQAALDEAQAAGVRVAYGMRVGVPRSGAYAGLNTAKIRVQLMLELAAESVQRQ